VAEARVTTLIRHVATFLLPASLVIALAILVKGYTQVGDGFSAGVVAALGVLLQYIGLGREEARRKVGAQRAMIGLVVGLSLMLLVVLVPALFGESVVTHYPGPEQDVVELGTLELGTAALFDVGVLLVVLSTLVLVLDHLIAAPEEAA
jgi:multisubunit Na+/H+ antiporter MnhB subunit